MNQLVLVVDDENKILQLARDYLENSGFQILSADVAHELRTPLHIPQGNL